MCYNYFCISHTEPWQSGNATDSKSVEPLIAAHAFESRWLLNQAGRLSCFLFAICGIIAFITKSKTPKKRRWLRITLIIVAVLVVIDIAAALYFYHVAFIRNNQPATQVKKSSPNYGLVQDFDKLPKSTKTITNDGLKLDAWYVPAATKTDKTVIVVHGYHENKSNMRQYGMLFHQLGYNVLMPDDRSAGDSEGDYISFGYYDKDDVNAWAHSLVSSDKNVDITLYGLSLGAATVMMASSLPTLPHQVSSIIEDCGYDNVMNEISYQAKQQYNLPAFPIVYSVSLENKLRQGWFFSEGSSTAALAKDTRPILMIHGTADTFVPYSMLQVNYDAVKAGTPKEELSVKGAVHAHSFETAPKLYRSTVSNFMDKYNPVK